MKGKKIIALLLAIALLLGCTACGNQDGGSSSSRTSSAADPSSEESSSESGASSAQTADADPYGPMPERVTLTIGRSEDANVSYQSGENSLDNYVVRYMSESLNIDYQHAFSVSGDEFTNKVALTIAGGDLPDTMTVNESQLRQLVAAGLIEDMTDVMNTYMSDSLRELYETTDGYALKSATFDGRIMAVPNVNAGEDAIPMLYIRQDWLKECNLEAPKTMEDVINIAKTFKEKQMGGENTCGLLVQQEIVTVGNSMYGLDAVFGLHDSFPELWYTRDDGTLAYGSVEPQTKEALADIRQMVADGIIEPDFAVRDSDKCNELVTSGKAGIFFACWWNLNWPLFDMTKEDPNVEWESYIVPLDGNEKYNTHMMSPTTSYQVVRKGYEWPEAVVKTANMQVDIDQDQGNSIKPDKMASFSWTMMPFSLLLTGYNTRQDNAIRALAIANGEMDEADYKPSEKSIVDDPDLFAVSQYNAIKTFQEGSYSALFENNLNSGYAFWKPLYVMALAQDNTNHKMGATYSYSPTMESKWATLQKLEAETFLQIITGEKPVDEFDNFVNQWKSLGGDTITEELTEMINS